MSNGSNTSTLSIMLNSSPRHATPNGKYIPDKIALVDIIIGFLLDVWNWLEYSCVTKVYIFWELFETRWQFEGRVTLDDNVGRLSKYNHVFGCWVWKRGCHIPHPYIDHNHQGTYITYTESFFFGKVVGNICVVSFPETISDSRNSTANAFFNKQVHILVD